MTTSEAAAFPIRAKVNVKPSKTQRKDVAPLQLVSDIQCTGMLLIQGSSFSKLFVGAFAGRDLSIAMTPALQRWRTPMPTLMAGRWGLDENCLSPSF
jgi:hypothetical protein